MAANETHIQDDAGQGSLHWLALSAAVIVADQATKLAADALLAPYQPVPVAPFANLTLVYNPGAAFSLLSDAGGWQRWLLLGLAVVVGAVLAAWLRQTPRTQPWTAAGIALVLGGAAGNAIDRLAYGYVIDFIDLYYQAWHWPAFNIADSAITIGILILLIEMFIQPRSPTGAS